MIRYSNKLELIKEIECKFNLYIDEFLDIKEKDSNLSVEGIDKTPKENILYQIGWFNLILSLKDSKRADYIENWNDISSFYKRFSKKYENFSLKEDIDLLNSTYEEFFDFVSSLSEEELFNKNIFNKTHCNPKWSICNWIYITSVSPLKNFRAQIRKWKRVKNDKKI